MMAYAQTNYQENVGNGPYTIAEIGCFVTAFCNLLQANGQDINPADLNSFFSVRDVYLADPSDGAGVKDDLTWGSITSYNPAFQVLSTGGPGWPDNDNAIVKFIYRSPRTGNVTTHFCKVADASAGTIVDSWDGVTKSPGVYGTPTAWAVYGAPIVEAVPVVSAAPNMGDFQVLVAIPGYATSNDAANHINPTNTVEPGNYIIFNEVHGMVNVTTVDGKPGSWIDPADNVKPAPPPPFVYTPFDEPMSLVVKEGGPLVNYATGDSNSVLLGGTTFTAVGKAVSTNGTVYFVSDPSTNIGVNTVDLMPSPAQSTDGEKVDVKVVSPPWQETFTAFLSPVEYIANTTLTVPDLNLGSSLRPQELLQSQRVMIAGTFTCDGIKYYRTAKSVANKVWYGIPVSALTKLSDEDELGDVIKAIEQDTQKIAGREKTIAKAASSVGFLQKIFGVHKNKGA